MGSLVSAVTTPASLLSDTAIKPEKKPAVLPVADDKSVKKRQKRSLIAQRQRSGRRATILSDRETLG